MATSIAGSPDDLNRESTGFVGSPHEIRRTVGRAWLAIAASGEKIRRALSIHHSQVSYRKSGAGAVASAALEIAALEHDDIDTDPLTDAIEQVKLAARRRSIGLAEAIQAEADADTAEDLAAAEFTIGLPGARERWAARLIAQSRESRRLAQVLLAGGQR